MAENGMLQISLTHISFRGNVYKKADIPDTLIDIPIYSLEEIRDLSPKQNSPVLI